MARKDQIEKGKTLGIDVSEMDIGHASEAIRLAQKRADQTALDKLIDMGLETGVDVRLTYGDVRKCRLVGKHPSTRNASVLISTKSGTNSLWVHPTLIKEVLTKPNK